MTEQNALSAADRIVEHVATIVAAYAATATLSEDALIAAIRRVHAELAQLGGGAANVPAQGATAPAVPIRKSVTPDFIVCLEDGQRVKMLKRYIMTHFNQTPAQYRAKWGLPPDYPMVAPSYAKKRSELAKAIGLGTKPNGAKPRGTARERRAGGRA